MGSRSMRVEPPASFRHAGDLSLGDALSDPRVETFAIRDLEIDLGGCSIVSPTALLWCAVYTLLARLRGTTCHVRIPDDPNMATYLQAIGLYTLLREAGVEVDDQSVPIQSGIDVVLPIVRLRDPVDVVEIANDMLLRLSELRIGAVSVRPLVSDVFCEIALNAVQHAESPIDAYGLIQFHESPHGNSFLCAVADGGIGIRRSLERNPMLTPLVSDDCAAVQLASQERITGVPDKTRGLGLAWLLEETRKPGGEMLLHSGVGVLTIGDGTVRSTGETTPFPGTLVFASIPT